MPLILAFDATGGRLAVGAFEGSISLAESVEMLDRGHAERLFPVIDEVLAEARRNYRDIDIIAVCTGPGNFTGARVGVAAARGLALSTGAIAVGVDRFEALALGHDGVVCVALTARGGAVHLARLTDGKPSRDAATLLPAEGVEFARDAVVIGDGAAELIAATGLGQLGAEAGDASLASLAFVAALRVATGSPARPAPRYLRPVNAALPREAAPQIVR